MYTSRRDSVLDSLSPTTPSPRRKITLSDLCEDVLLMICFYFKKRGDTSIKNLSLVNHRLRHLLIPHLFKTIYINRPLSQLDLAPLVCNHATTFTIDMFGSMWWWCSGAYVSSTDALDIFQLVRRMKRLRTVEIQMMKRSVDIFTAAFEQADDSPTIFTMPQVEKLVVTSPAAFLASHCPNLQALTIRDDQDCTVETYTDLPTRLAPLLPGILPPKITRFEATAYWSVEEISALVSLFPSLHHLHMQSDTYCYRASTSAISSLLAAGLPHLRTLRLAKISNLDTGYQTIWRRQMKGCSDAVYRMMLWRENEERRVAAENMVVRLMFGENRGLRECWVGEWRIARRMVGGLEWMWERRREEVRKCGWRDDWEIVMETEAKEGVVVRRELGR